MGRDAGSYSRGIGPADFVRPSVSTRRLKGRREEFLMATEAQTAPQPVQTTPAGWYADPYGDGQRYWDGARWTEHHQPTGQTAASPTQFVYVEHRGNGLAVASLVCGIVGFVLGLIPILFFVAWTLGPTAFILGLVGRGRAKRNHSAGRKTMATWGVVLGIAALGIGIAGYAIVTNVLDTANNGLNRTAQP